jgi:tRNA pseudouridine55 synthase
MDGKPLYEYARSNTPLPRPIEPRKQVVHELVLESWQEARTEEGGEGHSFRWPEKKMAEEDKELLEKSRKLMEASAASAAGSEIMAAPAAEPSTSAAAIETAPVSASQQETSASAPTPAPSSTRTIPPTFTLRMTVSSGTYVRSIVHDIGQALSSAAHVVVLTRTRQGDFALDKGNCVNWSVFKGAVEEEEREFKARGPKERKQKEKKKAVAAPAEDEEMMGNDEPVAAVEKQEENKEEEELKEWEKRVLEKFEFV